MKLVILSIFLAIGFSYPVHATDTSGQNTTPQQQADLNALQKKMSGMKPKAHRYPGTQTSSRPDGSSGLIDPRSTYNSRVRSDIALKDDAAKARRQERIDTMDARVRQLDTNNKKLSTQPVQPLQGKDARYKSWAMPGM